MSDAIRGYTPPKTQAPVSPPAAEGLRAADQPEIAGFDRDSDGLVTKDEFLTGKASGRQQSALKLAEEQFARFDDDKDGKLSGKNKREFMRALKPLQESLGVTVRQPKIFKAMDANKDGTLTKEELFASLIQRRSEGEGMRRERDALAFENRERKAKPNTAVEKPVAPNGGLRRTKTPPETRLPNPTVPTLTPRNRHTRLPADPAQGETRQPDRTDDKKPAVSRSPQPVLQKGVHDFSSGGYWFRDFKDRTVSGTSFVSHTPGSTLEVAMARGVGNDSPSFTIRDSQGKEVYRFQDGEAAIAHLVFTEDGKLPASMSGNRYGRLPLKAGETYSISGSVRPLEGHPNANANWFRLSIAAGK